QLERRQRQQSGTTAQPTVRLDLWRHARPARKRRRQGLPQRPAPSNHRCSISVPVCHCQQRRRLRSREFSFASESSSMRGWT
ncbi:AAEL009361-PA, partial [Aedes aegypti]